MRTKPLVVALFFFLMITPAWSSENVENTGDSGIKAWGDTLILNSSLFSQMGKYQRNGESLSEDFREDLASEIKDVIFDRDEQAIDATMTTGCKPQAKMDFLPAAFVNLENHFALAATESDFESGFARIEAIGCLQHGTATKAMSIFMDSAFRKATVPQLNYSRVTGNRICEKASAFPLVASAVDYCLDFTTHTQNELASGTQQIVSTFSALSANGDETQPVYFREDLITFADTASGVIAHYVIYIRGQDIAGFFRPFIQIRVSGSEMEAFRKLDQALAQ